MNEWDGLVYLVSPHRWHKHDIGFMIFLWVVFLICLGILGTLASAIF